LTEGQRAESQEKLHLSGKLSRDFVLLKRENKRLELCTTAMVGEVKKPLRRRSLVWEKTTTGEKQQRQAGGEKKKLHQTRGKER